MKSEVGKPVYIYAETVGLFRLRLSTNSSWSPSLLGIFINRLTPTGIKVSVEKEPSDI